MFLLSKGAKHYNLLSVRELDDTGFCKQAAQRGIDCCRFIESRQERIPLRAGKFEFTLQSEFTFRHNASAVDNEVCYRLPFMLGSLAQQPLLSFRNSEVDPL